MHALACFRMIQDARPVRLRCEDAFHENADECRLIEDPIPADHRCESFAKGQIGLVDTFQP